MTNAEKNIKVIDTFLNQHCDGFVLCAFDPVSGDSMMAVSAPDNKIEIALNAVLDGLLQNGGVGALRDRIKEKSNPPDGT